MIAALQTLGDQSQTKAAAMAALLRGVGFHAPKRCVVRARRHRPPKVLEAMARTKYTALIEVYDYADVEEMRASLEPNGDHATETTAKGGENGASRSAR
jgi:hypothetical protein